MMLCALFYVLGLCTTAVAAVAVPELVVRLNWWMTDGGREL